MRFSVNRDALYMPKSDLRQTQGTLAPIPPENSLRPLSPASISDRWCARMDRDPKRLFYGICWCNVGYSGGPSTFVPRTFQTAASAGLFRKPPNAEGNRQSDHYHVHNQT
jgi:hypothetical protein